MVRKQRLGHEDRQEMTEDVRFRDIRVAARRTGQPDTALQVFKRDLDPPAQLIEIPDLIASWDAGNSAASSDVIRIIHSAVMVDCSPSTRLLLTAAALHQSGALARLCAAASFGLRNATRRTPMRRLLRPSIQFGHPDRPIDDFGPRAHRFELDADRHNLAGALPCRIGGRQPDAAGQVVDGFQQAPDRVDAEHHRQRLGLSCIRYAHRQIGAPERDTEEKAQA